MKRLILLSMLATSCSHLPAVVRQWDCKDKQQQLADFVLTCGKSNDDLQDCYNVALKTVCTAHDVKIRIFD